jgi:hypothetical protein
MTEKCPFCGGSGELSLGEAGEVGDVLARPGVAAVLHYLYAQTGGGDAYRRAMVQHGYVIVDGDVRCGVPKNGCSCLLKKGHEGPHVCPHGEWTS